MSAGYSIRSRLLLGAALVLLAFLTGAGLAVQRANAEASTEQRLHEKHAM